MLRRALWTVGTVERAMEALVGEGGRGPGLGRLFLVSLNALGPLWHCPFPTLGHGACSQATSGSDSPPGDWVIRSEILSLPPASAAAIHLPTAARATFLPQTSQMSRPFMLLCLSPTERPRPPSHMGLLRAPTAPGFPFLAPSVLLPAECRREGVLNDRMEPAMLCGSPARRLSFAL